MSEVTFSDFEGLRAYGIHDLELRSHRKGFEMRVRTISGDQWVPVKAEDFVDAASVAEAYNAAAQQALMHWNEMETLTAITWLRSRGYTVIPPEEEE